MLARLKQSARLLKREVRALYFAYRDPRTPWYARIWTAGVLAYAFSPIDLIPDFIPFLGYLDDLLIIPVGVLVALKLIPTLVMAESRQRAEAGLDQKMPVGWGFVVVVIVVWGALLALLVRLLLNVWGG